jgi:hypothetical protein
MAVSSREHESIDEFLFELERYMEGDLPNAPDPGYSVAEALSARAERA